MPRKSRRPPEITSELEDGFVDLIFHVAEHRRRRDKTQTLQAAGLHEGEPIGFELVLGGRWEKWVPDAAIPLLLYRGTAAYRRTGPESDRFLQVLAALYGVRAKPKAMADETPFTAISLEGHPGKLADGPVRIKLFHEVPRQYAEVYTNIDLPAGRLEVHEKDADYRRPLVRGLTRK